MQQSDLPSRKRGTVLRKRNLRKRPLPVPRDLPALPFNGLEEDISAFRAFVWQLMELQQTTPTTPAEADKRLRSMCMAWEVLRQMVKTQRDYFSTGNIFAQTHAKLLKRDQDAARLQWLAPDEALPDEEEEPR